MLTNFAPVMELVGLHGLHAAGALKSFCVMVWQKAEKRPDRISVAIDSWSNPVAAWVSSARWLSSMLGEW